MNVTRIPKKTISVIEPKRSLIVNKEQYHQRRVAAYCRVSTDSEEQLTSYTNQKKVYTEMIAAKPEWEFAGLYADEGIYAAGELSATTGDNFYGDAYGIEGDLSVKSNTHTVKFGSEDVVFDADDVTYYIASYKGSRLVVDEYTGNDELIAAYQDKYNSGATTVNLDHVAAVVSNNGSNWTATVIFAWDGAATVEGGIIFFPTDIDKDDYDIVANDYALAKGYLNGTDEVTWIRVNPNESYAAGFYTFKIDDETGESTLTPYTGNDLILSAAEVSADPDYSDFYIDGNHAEPDVTVVDTRDTEDKVDTIGEVMDMIHGNYNEAPEHPVNVAYVLDGDEVVLVYVVNVNYYTATAYVDYINAHGAVGGGALTSGEYYVVAPATQTVKVWAGYDKTIEVTIGRDDNEGKGDFSVDTYTVTYWDTASESQMTATGTVSVSETYGEVITFEVEVTGNTTINVMSVK